MARSHFVIDDEYADHQPLNASASTSDLSPPRYSSESSIIQDHYDREGFEKDSRFQDESKLEQGSDEQTTTYTPLKKSHRQLPRKPFVAFLVGLLTLAALIGVLSARSFIAPVSFRKSGHKHISLDHIFNGTFAAQTKRIDWVKEASDGVYSHWSSSGDIILQDASDPAYEQVLLNATDVKNSAGERIHFQDWKLSSDKRFVVLKADHRKLWRHSSYGNYYIHRFSDHKTFALRTPAIPAEVAYVEWSPTSHSLAYVYQNDLYIVTAATLDQLEDMDNVPEVIRVTSDGSETVFNGVPDWVYEEEVFSTNFALWWSPQSDVIAYLRSDETKVKDYTLQYYSSTGDPFKSQPYPKNFVMKYPKPGSPNPLVTVHTFELNAHLSQAAPIPVTKRLRWDGEFKLEDRVITEVSWLGNDDLLVKEVDRAAKNGNVVWINGHEQRGSVVRKLGKSGEEGDDGWIENSLSTVPVKGTFGGYLDIVPTSEGYNHVAYFPTINTSNPVFLSSGPWEVSNGISGIDEERGVVYFLAATPSTERHLYQSELPTREEIENGTFEPRLTVLTSTERPGYHFASFSPKAGFYVLDYRGPDIPHQTLVTVGKPELDVVLEDNARLNATSAEYCMPIRSHSVVESDGIELNVVETLPPNFEASGRKRYPLLLNPYGGPGSQSVDHKFVRDWHHYLVCEKGIIVLTVDNRGTGFKGRGFRNWVRDRLGLYEVSDQVNVARMWAKEKYIDTKKIGIWGWSYGGFLSSKVIESDSGIFTLGMSVAPVTDWRYYDSVYTERYMSTPEDNPIGYHDAAINNVTSFNHADYLLAHGSGDDNVHYANTANLLEKFTQNQVRDFRFRMFTDSDHSMSGKGAYREVYEFMTAFLEEKWGKGKRSL